MLTTGVLLVLQPLLSREYNYNKSKIIKPSGKISQIDATKCLYFTSLLNQEPVEIMKTKLALYSIRTMIDANELKEK